MVVRLGSPCLTDRGRAEPAHTNNPELETMTNPPRRHKITKAEARALMARRPDGLATRGGHFPREVIDGILAQPGCAGVRFYYGTNPDGSPAIVLVGIDENNNDLTDGDIVDNHYPCPPFCGGGDGLA
jgi:hypothetical protein